MESENNISNVGEYLITDLYIGARRDFILGYARGYKKWNNGTTEWATWEYNKRKDNYYSGHYMMTEEESLEDFKKRIGF